MDDPIAKAVFDYYNDLIRKYDGARIDFAALYGNLIAVGIRTLANEVVRVQNEYLLQQAAAKGDLGNNTPELPSGVLPVEK